MADESQVPCLQQEKSESGFERVDMSSTPAHHHHHSRPRWASRFPGTRSSPAMSHGLVFVLTSLFWLSIYFVMPLWRSRHYSFVQDRYHNSTLVRGANFYHCGDNIQYAKSVGCVYDILNNHWVPERCIDYDAIAEYQADDSWQGFRDANHTDLLTLEEMGETPIYYTNERDHILHCAMLWRKQYRAYSEERPLLDSITVDEEHTMHCSQYLIDMTTWGPDFRTMPIKVHVGYAGCHVKE